MSHHASTGPLELARRALRSRAPDQPVARRLFWFPHAGGSSTSFPSWHRFFPSNWEIAFLEVPIVDAGSEPETLEDVLAIYLEAMRTRLDVPFGFFGHSLGALFAFELTRRLVAEKLPPPTWIGLSARRPPHLASARGLPHSQMTDDELLSLVRSYGGTPPQILADAGFRELLLDRLRRDLRWSERHEHRDGEALDLPMTLFSGTKDPSAPPEAVAEWQHYSKGPIETRVFEGGHFYLFTHRDAICQAIARDLGASLE
ncbi:MAG: thioesterase domain-containing protein [Planctomycetota bacterium]